MESDGDLDVLKEALWRIFLAEVGCIRHRYNCIGQMVDDIGFTGPFAGMDCYISKVEFVSALEKIYES